MTKKPSYRFAGYTEPWKEKKLGEVSEKVREKNSDNLYSSVLTNSAEFGIIPQRDFFDKDIANEKNLNGYYIVKQNDFVYNPRISNYAPVGPIKPNKLNEVGIMSPLYYVFRTHDIENSYLATYFDTTYWHKFMKINGDSGARADRFAIKDSVFVEMPIPFPSLPEQTAIGSFFQDIDQLISLQQRKLEVLKEQKKTYLKLLFPTKGQKKPAFRFAGFEDEWKEVKLGEVLKKNNKKNQDLAINNVESVSNKFGFIKQTEQFDDYSVASADLSNYYVISEKQFAYNPSRINVGSIAYKKEGESLSVVSPLYISFSTVENLDDSYLWYWFKTSLFDSQRATYSEGGVRDTLSYIQLSEIKLILPSLPEQIAIGSFFQDLDKAIAKQEEKVNQLKESKQTLLRKMFI
jgi:hypothetical protein